MNRPITDFSSDSRVNSILDDPSQMTKTLSSDYKFSSYTDDKSDDLKSSLDIVAKVKDVSNRYPLGNVIGQLKGEYILSENAMGLVVINIREIYLEKVYQLLSKAIELDQIKPLIIPQTLIFDKKSAKFLSMHLDLIKKLGLLIENLGEATFVLRSVARFLQVEDFKKFFIDIAMGNDIVLNEESLKLELINALDKQLELNNDIIDNEELSCRVREFEKTKHPVISERGHNIWKCFSLNQIATLL